MCLCKQNSTGTSSSKRSAMPEVNTDSTIGIKVEDPLSMSEVPFCLVKEESVSDQALVPHVPVCTKWTEHDICII